MRVSAFPVHALAVIAACALWGLDNNLTRPIPGGDPVTIAMVKGLVAGGANLALGQFAGESWPAPGYAVSAMTLGGLSYGVSLVFYIMALRHLGSARTAAHFGTAPFIGAVLSVLLLGEPLTATVVVAFALTLAATGLVLTERHAHEHTHEAQHTHRHVHDASITGTNTKAAKVPNHMSIRIGTSRSPIGIRTYRTSIIAMNIDFNPGERGSSAMRAVGGVTVGLTLSPRFRRW
jgi:uncharacterized membrane protein